MANRLAWFTTRNGKYTMRILASTTVFGSFAVSFVPQTFFLDKYMDFMTLRKFNKPVPVSPELRKLWNTVLDNLGLNDYHRNNIKPFMVFGFDLWHAGSLQSNFGSIIGLPINLTYTNVEEIEKEKILIGNEPVNWNRDDAKKFLHNLILSDDARKYAMAREILMTNNSSLYMQSVTPSIILAAYYVYVVQMNESLKMFEKSRALRVLMYSLSAVFFWGIWAMQKDGLRRHYEYETDEHLSQLGVNYIEGAIEFCDRTLKRNIALKTLFGGVGDRMFSAAGNQTHFFRQKYVPLTDRKSFFEDKLKALTIKTSDDEPILTSEIVNVA